jgi:hypothetical protein
MLLPVRPWVPVSAAQLALVKGGDKGSRIFHKNLGVGRVIDVYEPSFFHRCVYKFRSMITVRFHSEPNPARHPDGQVVGFENT